VGVDVTVAGSQKGLMLPPGLSFNAISEKALAASKSAGLRKAYWDWQPMLAANTAGFFPFTPATNLLYGLRERFRCSGRKAWTMCSRATTGTPRLRGAPCVPGASRFFAPIRRHL